MTSENDFTCCSIKANEIISCSSSLKLEDDRIAFGSGSEVVGYANHCMCGAPSFSSLEWFQQNLARACSTHSSIPLQLPDTSSKYKSLQFKSHSKCRA
jgi:hypothetical protein